MSKKKSDVLSTKLELFGGMLPAGLQQCACQQVCMRTLLRFRQRPFHYPMYLGRLMLISGTPRAWDKR